jgi:uncharacterized Fe-S radical SAM superfamily protein PflX
MLLYEIRWSTRLRHYATGRKVAGSSPDEVDFFNLPNPSSCTMGPGVDSVSNRNEYQKSSCGVKGGAKGCYRDSFTFLYEINKTPEETRTIKSCIKFVCKPNFKCLHCSHTDISQNIINII